MQQFSECLDKKSGQCILNLGAGKEQPLDLPNKPYMLVNVDSGYFDGDISNTELVLFHKNYVQDSSYISKYTGKYFNTPGYVDFILKEDAFKFMEKYPLKFDRIVIYRFLEHVKRTDVLYFIYLMATSLKSGGVVDCIVPNYNALAGRILSEDPFGEEFEAEDIITTYELLNEPESPHCSIWTPARIRKFFMLEKRFSVIEMDDRFGFDGRDIYLRAIMKRV